MAKMAPLQVGKYNKHVNESYGANNNIMKFYITEYSSKLGIDGFKPKHGQHIGTGYESNFRPAIYYSRKLDELDNRTMGRMVSDNYHSITDKHYKPYCGSTGKDALPAGVSFPSSGYLKVNKQTVPSYKEANSVFAADPTLLRRNRPLLHLDRNPLDNENNRLGPGYFSTECHMQYQRKPQHIDISAKAVGSKEDSGFTRSKNLEPITHRPDECYDGMPPGWYMSRPTGVSISQTAYLPYKNSSGREKLQDIALNANRDTGFTRFIQPTAAHTASKGKAFTKLSEINNPAAVERLKKADPAEYTNVTYPDRFPSLSQTTYRGTQLHQPTLMDQLGRVTIGSKEDSGYVENNQSYKSPIRDGKMFDTHYGNEFYDKNHPVITERGKLKDECVRQPQDDGFTKSEKLHSFGQDANVKRDLQFLHPYVNRSLKARDPFYAERIHESKRRNLLIS